MVGSGEEGRELAAREVGRVDEGDSASAAAGIDGSPILSDLGGRYICIGWHIIAY